MIPNGVGIEIHASKMECRGLGKGTLLLALTLIRIIGKFNSEGDSFNPANKAIKS